MSMMASELSSKSSCTHLQELFREDSQCDALHYCQTLKYARTILRIPTNISAGHRALCQDVETGAIQRGAIWAHHCMLRPSMTVILAGWCESWWKHGRWGTRKFDSSCKGESGECYDEKTLGRGHCTCHGRAQETSGIQKASSIEPAHDHHASPAQGSQIWGTLITNVMLIIVVLIIHFWTFIVLGITFEFVPQRIAHFWRPQYNVFA